MIAKKSRYGFTLLVSSLLVLTACSSSSDEPSNEGSTASPTESEQGVVVSGDGILALTPGDDSVAITIANLDNDDLTADGLTVLNTYELGPDGSTFETPVEVRVSITNEDLAAGVAVVLESSDGSIESVNIEIVTENNDKYLVGEIDHFSRLRILKLNASEVEVVLPVEMLVDESVPLVLRHRGQQVDFPTTHDQWIFVAPLALAGAEAVTCLSEGPGLAEFAGETSFELVNSSFLQPETIRFVADLTAVGEVVCVRSTPIKFADQRCVDMLTGAEAEGCLFPSSVTISGSDPAVLKINYADAAEAPEVILSVFMNDDESNPILLERHSDGRFNGFSGLGFGPFEPGDEISSGELVESEAGLNIAFSSAFLLNRLNQLVLEMQESTSFDGSAIEAGDRVITSFTIFTAVGDLQSTVLLDIADIVENWSE